MQVAHAGPPWPESTGGKSRHSAMPISWPTEQEPTDDDGS
jgi:hypothetical protein